jgi:Holliday junction DNA helicase RuvB
MTPIGNENTKNRINMAVKSAVQRNTCVPHMLLSGAAGCGKTTTARWITGIGQYDYIPASPLEMKTKKSVYSLLEKLNTIGYNERGDRVGKIRPTIIFFDEIHQMPVIGQEILGLAMERFILESDLPNKMIWLPYFTIVGATTDDGKLTKPFRDRFKMRFIFEPYKDEEMCKMVRLHAYNNKIQINDAGVMSIAKRSRGVPRVMVSYLENIRDFMINSGSCIITDSIAEEAFKVMGIDDTGLTDVEIKILKTLMNSKGPIGLDNLSIVTNESPKAITQSIEPFLIRRGLMLRTGKGRELTEGGRKYLEDRRHIGNNSDKKFIDANYTRG